MTSTLIHARLVDQNYGTAIKLPESKHAVVGLSVADKLIIDAGRGVDSHIVVVLFELETKQEGHWLFPNPDIPTSVNDAVVCSPVLLSQGTSIAVGDRYLEYKYPIPRANLEETSPKKRAPPKPKRTSCQDGEVILEDTREITTSTESLDDNDMMSNFENELTKSQAIEVRQRLESAPRGSVDDDLLSQISTRDQLCCVVASLVTQQAVLCTELNLSSSQVDTLFKSFQTEASSVHETVYRTFLADFKELSDGLITLDSNTSIGRQHHGIEPGTRPLQCELHDPVIVLLTEMLRITPFPMDHVITWLTLLRTFSHFLENINVFVREKTAAVVMGCMSAHSDDPAVQQQSCGVLAQVALYIPVIDEKGPIRECGVELIVRAMKEHPTELFVLRPACCALANLTMTCANFTNKILDNIACEADQEEHGVVRAMMILEFIRERALPTVYDAHKKFPSDGIIHTETRKIIAFFTGMVAPHAAVAKEPDLDTYNTQLIRKPGAEQQTNTPIQITIGSDSNSDESTHGDFGITQQLGTSPSTERRVQFAEQVEDCWYDTSISSDGKCARWLGLENKQDNAPNMKSLFDELVEAEQANDDNSDLGVEELEEKKDEVARKLGLAGVVKGYFKKLKQQISKKDDVEQQPEEICEDSEVIDNFTPVLEYNGGTPESDIYSSSVDNSDADLTSSQEWTQIESGIYCKVDKSDSLPKNDIRPLSLAQDTRQLPTGYTSQFRKKGLGGGGSLQDLRTQDTLMEKRVYPKGILKNSNLNLNFETQSEGGDSDFDACVRANTDNSETLDDFDAPVLYAVPVEKPDIIVTAPDLPNLHSEEVENASLSDIESVASDIGYTIERINMDAVEDEGVTNLKKTFSKSEPALNKVCLEVPKQPKSSVVADKVKKYMDRIKDASSPSSSSYRFTLPKKTKKYDLQKKFPSKFGNDEFIMKPNYHLRINDQPSGADFGVNPFPEDPNITHRREHRGWSVTSSDEGLDGNEITLTVLDTSSPVAKPRMSKRHSIAVTPSSSFQPAKQDEFTPLTSKTKSTSARKKGVAGALKSYAKKFQRRKSEADIKTKQAAESHNAETLNKNNNNNISKNMQRASSACVLDKPRSPNLRKQRLSSIVSSPDINRISEPQYDIEDLLDDGKMKTILSKRLQVIQHFISLMDTDTEMTVTNLTRITQAAMASAALPSLDDKDFGLLVTDPSLGLSLYEVCVRKRLTSDCGMRMLQSFTEQLQKSEEPTHRHKMCEILLLLLQPHTQDDGWGFFTLRKLHRVISDLIRQGHVSGDVKRDYVNELNSIVEDMITHKG